MKADLSRNSFDRTQHFSSVRLQQGRIVTDADWNEQADIMRYRAESQARDIIGLSGAPLGTAGYRLVAETNALAVHARDADVAWIVAEDGAMLTTANGGADWSLVNLVTAADLRAIAAVADAGWVVGDGGVVRKTTDAGSSWMTQNAGTVQSLRGVAAIDADHAWAVGDGGTVISTSDGGVSWNLVQTEAARLDAVGFADAFNGIAVGQGGMILRTIDGGATWTVAPSGSTAHLHALARVGATRLWVAGEGGSILRSEDGGTTWLPGVTSTAAALYAIAFLDDAREGWAVGEGGTVLHSADGGGTWQREDRGKRAATLRGLSIVGGEAAWAVGDGGTVLRAGSGSPAISLVTVPAVNLSIEPGRYYVDGTMCELEERCSYAQQADGGGGTRLGRGAYLLYLNAWQRHISALQAPAIREIALGGPDTATRARAVGQVRALLLPDADPLNWNCDSRIPVWDALINMPRPRLAARAEPQLAAANLCEIAATAGYRRLENQLYRVEVHAGGANPSFKWSRENGSVAYAVVNLAIDSAAQRTTVRVAARGRDATLDLSVNDQVELIDDDAELTIRAGELFEYIEDGNDELELVLAGVPTRMREQDMSRHPVLRRWDHKPAVAGTNVLPIVEGTWVELEDGVQVRFEAGGVYRPGDYWQIPARSSTADVEWPRDDDGDPVAREPDGVTDAYCRLAIVEVAANGTVKVTSDCRELFPPLTGLEQLLYVSGDGQDAAPSTLLPQPLALRVSRGTVPVAGARVRFDVESGGGLVGDGPGILASRYETTTDDAGLATCRWTLGPGLAAPARYQRVHARLLDADRQPVASQGLAYCATATAILLYVSGDGQSGSAGGALANPLEFRVANGGNGVTGIVLTATVDQGGGSVIGSATMTTDSEGYASVGWQLGPGDAQRLTVRLTDSDGHEVQRLTYSANIASAGTARGNCDITIGRGGQFEHLDNELLSKLLQASKGHLCLCFLPGIHEVDVLSANGGGESRLSLHGCGPTAVLNVRGSIQLTNFATVELRDQAIKMKDAGVALVSIGEARLSGVSLARSQVQATDPLLDVRDVKRLLVTNCDIGPGVPASAVFESIAEQCHINSSRFDGPVSFYGKPSGGPSPRALLDALGRSPSQPPKPLQLTGRLARLHLVDNSVQLLTVAGATAAQLVQIAKDEPVEVFQTAILHGNTFGGQNNVFVGALLSFVGNSFVVEPIDGPALYGVMIANRATATANMAASSSDNSFLHFVTPEGSFSEAANEVLIHQQPTPSPQPLSL
jgi:photosystem II stability/assembly factor-like uncharacterized protein